MHAPRTSVGRFIVLEGPDGAGKSLQAARLAGHLRANDFDVVTTREPGGTPIGEHIRSLLLDEATAGRSPAVDALLFNAARAQLVRDVIAPALERGSVVISDRFAPSTLAYQGQGAGLPLDELLAMERVATGGLEPDLVLLLDLPAGAGLQRRAAGDAADLTRFERSPDHGADFHARVRDGYLRLARSRPDRWRTIDADRSPDAVAEDVRRAVKVLLSTSEPNAPLVRMGR